MICKWEVFYFTAILTKNHTRRSGRTPFYKSGPSDLFALFCGLLPLLFVSSYKFEGVLWKAKHGDEDTVPVE